MDGASAVIGLSASILQLIGTTIKALEYISDVKDGKEERNELALQLRVLDELLHKLESKAKSSTAFAWMSESQGPLQQIKIAMETIVKQLHVGTGARKVLDSAIWPYRRRQISRFLGQVEALKSTLTLALSEDNLSETQELKTNIQLIQDTTTWLREDAIHSNTILQLTESIRADTQAIRLASEDAANQAMAKKRLVIAEWFSDVTPAADQSNIIRGWQNGTGSWFLDSQNFQRFREDSKSVLLCLGRPGAGKSVTAAVVVQYLWQRYREHRSTKSVSPGVAFIFFNYRKGEAQGVYNVLALLVKQLLIDLQEVPPHVLGLHELLAKRGARPTIQDLYEALRSAITAHGITYIVLDALDECDLEVRAELMEGLFALQQEVDIRLMATGREIPEVTELFMEGCMRSSIRANDEDVRIYIQPRLKSLGRFVQKDDELQTTIIDKIIEAADGMFLLAQLHLESLKGQTSKRGVKDALTNLPRGRDAIDKAYEDNIARIDTQSPQRRDLAHLAIIWTQYPDRSLFVDQLREAVSIKTGDEELDRDGLPDSDLIIDVCCGLLVLEKDRLRESVIRFVHYTTEEFFRRHLSIWIPDAFERLQLACLTFLQFNRTERLPQSDDAEHVISIPKLETSIIRSWAAHFKPPYTLSDKVRHELLNLLLDNTKCERLAINESSPKSFNFRDGFTGLHLAAQNGLHNLIPDLLKQSEDSNITDSSGRTPLDYAVIHREFETVRCLLDLSAHPPDPWVLDNDGLHAVDYAWDPEDPTIFNDLRSNRQSLRALLEHQPPRLRDAVITGNIDTVKAVLEKPDVDINRSGAYGRTAFHEAVFHSKSGTEMVQILLTCQGIEVNARDQYGLTPLHVAVEVSGDAMITTLRMLLARDDVDVNPQNSKGQTPLHLAVADGNIEAARSLLEHPSINLHLKSNFGALPITLSVMRNYPPITNLLLDHKDCDINEKDAFGRTPLIMAIYWDMPNIGLLLLSKPGIDVNIADAWDKTPLMRAAAKGFSDLVRGIVNIPNADIGKQDNDGHDAAWCAKRYKHDIATFLEDAIRKAGQKPTVDANSAMSSEEGLISTVSLNEVGDGIVAA